MTDKQKEIVQKLKIKLERLQVAMISGLAENAQLKRVIAAACDKLADISQGQNCAVYDCPDIACDKCWHDHFMRETNDE